MTPDQAAGLLDVGVDAPWEEVRRAYRDRIRTHHPDRAGAASSDHAAAIIEAYGILAAHRRATGEPPPRPLRRPQRPAAEPVPGVARIDADTVLIAAPADETFRLLTDAANDIGDITYVDRSVPILEVLCRFEGEPATSLVITLQGRITGTEAFCTVESIEARPAPPAGAVVDLLELALRRRQDGSGQPPPAG